ncbi:MAG: isochorismatase family protein [Chloroflexi bacterium]|nr:isochorismatase family protein [Chloroflexota bacterium]
MYQDGTRELYQRAQIGHRVGYGERPAVLVIDFFKGMTDPTSPLGANMDPQIEATAQLLAAARAKGVPVAHTTVIYSKGGADGGVFVKKIPSLRLMEEGSGWSEFDERVKPLPGEHVIVKKHQSAFFGTNLAPLLSHLRVDTLIVAGCTTSGCVRASCFDAQAWGFQTIVARECVTDRSQAAHEANLFDIDSKSADVEPLDRVLDYLEQLPVAGEAPEAPLPAR